jgi:hypothetical protein
LVTESQISISLKEWKTLRVLKLVGGSEVSISFEKHVQWKFSK